MTRSAARAMALTACLTVGIHSASAIDYPPPPGPYKSEPGEATGLSPSLGVGPQSAEPSSTLPEDTAQVLPTGSSGRETIRDPIDTTLPPRPTPSGGVTGRFRPAAATEYSQRAVVPRPAATPLSPDDRFYPARPEKRLDATPGSPGRADSASDRPDDLTGTSTASATGDARVGNGASDLRTHQPRSSVDGRGTAQRTPQTPVFRPPEATER